MTDDEVMGYAGAAAHTGLAKGTVRAMVCRRQIPHLRLGPRLVRFRRSDLDRWLHERLVLSQPAATNTPSAAPQQSSSHLRRKGGPR